MRAVLRTVWYGLVWFGLVWYGRWLHVVEAAAEDAVRAVLGTVVVSTTPAPPYHHLHIRAVNEC